MRPPFFLVLRLRTLFAWMFIPVLAAAWWWAIPQLWLPASGPTVSVSGRVVAIDPGHGGIDPGAVGVSGLLEKEVTLAIAQELKPLLGRVAIYSVLLREDDRDLAGSGQSGVASRKREDLKARVDTAVKAGADLYISLHANSFPSPRWSGAQTFYYPGDEESRRLAVAIQRRLREAVPSNTRTARPGEYFVLRESPMPAVVVEVGFLSNPEEEKLLATAGHRRLLARAIYAGIVDYLAALAPSELEREAPASAEPFVGQPLSGPMAEPLSAPTAEPSPLPRIAAGEREFFLFFAAPQEEVALAASAASFPQEFVGASLDRRIEYALQRLIAGPPPGSDHLPTLPAQVKVLDVKVRDGEADILLSREARTYFWGGGQSESRFIESVVRTVGQFETVDAVRIMIEGDSDGILAGHMDISRPFAVPLE